MLGATPRHRSAVVERLPAALPITFSLREFARLAEAVDPAALPDAPGRAGSGARGARQGAAAASCHHPRTATTSPTRSAARRRPTTGGASSSHAAVAEVIDMCRRADRYRAS